jgi:hypothetical protein
MWDRRGVSTTRLSVIPLGVASRLESNAPAGEIYIAQSTFDNLRGLFDCRQLEIKVKGEDDSLACHSGCGLISRKAFFCSKSSA